MEAIFVDSSDYSSGRDFNPDSEQMEVYSDMDKEAGSLQASATGSSKGKGKKASKKKREH